MGTFDNSISALKSKLSKIAEATRALSGSTKKLSLDEIPNLILQNTGTFCYYLGQGTSFNIKSLYPTQYMNFTVDNFIVDDGTYSVSCSATYGGSASTSGKLTKSYNKSTGVFTVGGTSISCGGSDVHNGVWSYGDGFSDRTFYVNGSASRSPKVWVVSSIRTAGEANYCYYLGTLNGDGQINVAALYPNTYQNFNANNFIVCASTVSGGGYGGYNWNSGTETCNYSIPAKTPSVSYSNGILKITGTSTSGSYPGGRPDNTGGATVNMSNIKVYLVSSINLSSSTILCSKTYSVEANSSISNSVTVKAQHNGKIIVGACTVGSHASTVPTVKKNGGQISATCIQSAGGFGSATAYFVFNCYVGDSITVNIYGSAGAETGATGSIFIVEYA